MSPPVVLIVDANTQSRAALERVAQRCGCATRLAADGLEALAAARASAPDVVIADAQLPGMSGRRLTTLLRELPRMADRPILVCLPDASKQARIELLAAGADDFLLQPVAEEELLARLRSLARRGAALELAPPARAGQEAALERLERRNQELEQLNFSLITALERANIYPDVETGNHIRRVCACARMLALAAGCEPEHAEEIARYAGLHDVGKVALRDGVLRKLGKLTPDEFEEMKAHTLIGGELLRGAGLPTLACNIPLYHHERWDGKGYPYGVSGEEIPLEARIVAVADVYDALRSERSYKPAFSFEKSREIMREMAGTQLDPRLVSAFFAQEEELLRIAARYVDEPDLAAAAR